MSELSARGEKEEASVRSNPQEQIKGSDCQDSEAKLLVDRREFSSSLKTFAVSKFISPWVDNQSGCHPKDL